MLIVAAALLAVAAGPALADKPSPGKPPAPDKIGGKTLEQWIEKITARGDPSVRETAIRAVPYFGKSARAAAPALLLVLQNDPDVACRVYAAMSLSTLANLSECLSEKATADAVKVLTYEADVNLQAIVRLHAVWALGSFGPKAALAIPVLVKRVHDKSSWELRQAALICLAAVAQDKKFGPEGQAVAGVTRLLVNGNERSSRVRLAAVMALREMGRPREDDFKQAIEALNKAHKDPDKSVSIWAVVALIALEDKVTEERLSEVARYLKGKDVMVKVTAVTALGALGKGAKSRIPDIIDLLSDPDPIAMAAAIDVLAGFKSDAEKAVPDLRRIMAKKDQLAYFRDAARNALKEITGKEEKAPDGPATPRSGTASEKVTIPSELGGKSLSQWIAEIKSNPDPSVQETAMKIVPYFGAKAGTAAQALIARLKDTENPDIACRAHAILALSAIADDVSDDDAAKAVRQLMNTIDNDGQAILRYHATVALGSYGLRATVAIPNLAHRIQDPNSWELRQAAVSSLSTIAGGSDKIPPDGRAVLAIASRLLGDIEKSAQVRMAAVMGLGAMGRPALASEFRLSVQALLKEKTDPDKSVQIWAMVALMAVDKVTKEGLNDVAKFLTGKDAMAKVTAMRALGAMGKEAKPKVLDIINLVDDDDPLVAATAIDVLGQFGSVARDAIPALKKVMEKKDQTEYFKDAAKGAIALIDGPPPKVKK